ncbi:adenylate/guanylate cyclase domain-containing protein [Fulvivirga sedimenti]|uniref:Adenylate/guanylate cyclase domain-containing protein n=1 Tax=Fulvivirga sedimenti TaxID=2879465 RepID=A0A9X1HKS9_9BACT|nr:adenylate/guanylate cyclase domain-containing protein [Fulvivirga sedimenti]MCA6074079.1 adenylate/guanylate cyclase domain-containing protein [Fulvivirga sedimenti]
MRHFSEIRNITLTGLVAGTLYSLLTDDLSKPAPILNGVFIGLIGGFLAGVFELLIFRPRKSRPAFALTVFLKVLTYFVLLSMLILLVKGRIDSLFMPETFSEYVRSDEFLHFIKHGEFKRILIFSLFTIVVIIFTMQTSKYLGKGVLFNLITGRYFHPQKEQKIFLLIDICSSTSIAESMDQIEYFKLLDRFFFDVFEGVRAFEGYIYRYVGDQVTIVWSVSSLHKNANCIRAFFAIKHQLHIQREYYLKRFGFVPDFRGTAHIGDVMAVEIGDVKTQVVYQGYALYAANRMEKAAGRSYNGLCISSALAANVELPNFCQAVPCENTTAQDLPEMLEITES